MLREELKQLDTSPRALRRFGLMVGGVCLLLGLWFFVRHKPWAPWFALPGAPLAFLGAIAPKSLRTVYLGWMALAIVLGTVVSILLLTLLFFGVVTPIGWVARLCGRDFLNRKFEPGTASYWLRRERRPRPKQSYERQY